MIAQHDTSTVNERHVKEDVIWVKLYCLLRPQVRSWVVCAHIPSWLGQEEDILEDVIQETIMRLYRYSQRTQCGEVAPIRSIEHLSIVVARNCFIDIVRKERCLTRLSPCELMEKEFRSSLHIVDPSEIACENVYQEWLFRKTAEYIITLPEKQKKALLTDIACRMAFASRPTPLQRAFQEVGVHLEEYRQPVTGNAGERSRHFSALSTAYRRLCSAGVNS
jgi:DNA-directed RNA polymerase specialized sigma24 family protein